MHKKKITPTGALLYVFLTVVLVFMMIPFVWLLISSLRPNADLFNEPFAVPKTLSFENFRAVMESHPMLLYFANSVAIATIATVIAVGAATLAAYAMQQRFLTRKSLTVLFSMCLFIPTNAFMVPYYVMINKIGLYDNVLGIALVYAGVNLPMSFMVIKGFTFSELVNAHSNPDAKGISPADIYGIDVKKFREDVQGLAISFPKHIRVSFVANLDNIILEDYSSGIEAGNCDCMYLSGHQFMERTPFCKPAESK